MPYYVTKYGLTAGIIEIPDDAGEVSESNYLRFHHGDSWKTSIAKAHWTRDLSTAQAMVRAMMTKKVVALRKQADRYKQARRELIPIIPAKGRQT